MGNLLASSFLSMAVLSGTVLNANAQESSNRHQYLPSDSQIESREIEPNGEGESTGNRTLVKQDSSYFKPSTSGIRKSTTEIHKQNPKKGDEDAVSFNFLYYIIQRFKTSDIIED